MFYHISEYLKNSKQFILRVLKANHRIFKYISAEFKEDNEILQVYYKLIKK
jgi:hypothetical protein